MRQRISVKGVVIGSISDIVGSNVWGVLLVLYLTSRYNLASTPPSQLGATITSTIRGEPVLFALNLLVGGLFSVLGGYISARIARRNELLNGALASFLCVFIGIYSMVSGASHDPLWLQFLWLALSPALALLGGFSRLRQRSRGRREQVVTG